MAADGFDIGGALNNFNNIMAQGYRDRMSIQQEGNQNLRSLQMEGIKDKRARELKAEEFAHQEKMAQQKAQAMKDMYGTKAAAAAGPKDLKRLAEFGKIMNPDIVRSGTPLGNARMRDMKAENIQKLAAGVTDYDKLTPQQVYEIATSFNALVTGGMGSITGTEHLVPKSFLGDANALHNYIMNQPGGAGQGAFVKNMLDSVSRERQVAQDQVQRGLQKASIAYADLKQKFPDQYAGIVDTGIKNLAPNLGAPPSLQNNLTPEKLLDFKNKMRALGVSDAQLDSQLPQVLPKVLGRQPQGGMQLQMAPQATSMGQPQRQPQSIQPTPPPPNPWVQPVVPGGAAQQTLPLPNDMMNYLDSGQ